MTKFNWLLLRAIKKKICAQTIRKPIRIQKSSCKNVGVAQKKKTIIDDKIRPMKLFINNICVFFSYLVKSLIKIASNPKQIAPKIETNATGSMYKFKKSGLIKINAPTKVISIAIHL